MGCIHTKNNVQSLFKVENIAENGTALWNGQLEITAQELILYRRGKEPTKWSLKHLRRYGFDADLFTFEAGRRCTTGEGIYAFRCNQSDQLFEILRSHIEGITANEDVAILSGNNENNSGFDHLSSTINTLRQRQNLVNVSSNAVDISSSNQAVNQLPNDTNYLEPTPSQIGCIIRQSCQTRFDSVSSGPISPEIESTDSLHSFTIIPEGSQHTLIENSNVYQEFSLKWNEHNNNEFIKISTDRSPENPAPNLNESDHMYENVKLGDMDSLGVTSPTVKQLNMTPKQSPLQFFDEPIRSYVNVDIGEMRPTLIRNRYSKPDIFSKVDLPSLLTEQSEPTTPITKQEARTVNYIVLDLGDQSPSSQPNSTLTLITSVTTTSIQNGKPITTSAVCKKSTSSHMLTKSLSTGSGISTTSSIIQNAFNANPNFTAKPIGSGCLTAPESPKIEPFGYATIDFNKTVALSNSTATRSRNTSCIRQSNSISD